MTTLDNTSLNPQYTKAIPKWSDVRDAVNDDIECNAIKKGYIIKPPGMSEENYKAYVERAVFKNFVGKTLRSQKGAAFGKEFSFSGVKGSEIPESLRYLVDNVDGSGTSLEDQVKLVGQDVFSIGRVGAMVEYRGGGNGSLAESNKAKIVTYTAESIHDWNESFSIEVDNKLVYVLLVETYSKFDNGSRENVERKIILKLDDDGFYTQTITEDNKMIGDVIEPKFGNGERMNVIPFKFIGADNNKPDVSQIPLFDLTKLNIAMYRSDADARTLIHLCSVPNVSIELSQNVDPSTFARSNGLDIEGTDRMKPLKMGGVGYVGGKMEYIQASADSFMLEYQKIDKDDMISLGAQEVTIGRVETAEAAIIRKAAGTVSLGDMVGNIEDAYYDLFMWCSMMNNQSGQADEFEFNMNKKFFDDRLTPQMLQQLGALALSNQIPQQTIFKAMKRDGSLGVDDEMEFDDFVAMIQEQAELNPTLNLDE